jgi:phospholipase/carboxylesterase
MTDRNEAVQSTELDGLVLKYLIPEGEGPFPVILMLHGWTGDENSMWVFGSKMPPGALLIAPRGLYASSLGGYSWYPEKQHSLPKLDDFSEGIAALQAIVNAEVFSPGDFSGLRMVGFSQGAALVYSFALRRPDLVRSFAGLSGFVPEGAHELVSSCPLDGKFAFVAHGAQDQIVPVDRARQGVDLLQQAGAQVTYCEDDVGHKLSAACFRGMQNFFKAN